MLENYVVVFFFFWLANNSTLCFSNRISKLCKQQTPAWTVCALFVILPIPDKSKGKTVLEFDPCTIKITYLSVVLKEAYNGQTREHCAAGIIPLKTDPDAALRGTVGASPSSLSLYLL